MTELQRLGATVTPLQAANCGFDVGWSAKLAEHAGEPIKPVILHATGPDGQSFSRAGEFVLTSTGVEGSLIYAASRLLRQAINATGEARIELDLLPQRPRARCWPRSSTPRQPLARQPPQEPARHRRRQGRAAARSAEPRRDAQRRCAGRADQAPALGAQGPAPVAEAISTAGGVAWASLDEGLMQARVPGVFCAGEMLDWEAPTGGYLLTASFASGRAAAHGLLRWFDQP